MDEKLKKDIEAHVATIFSEKEEADMRKKTEEALQKAAATIEDLTNSLDEKNAEFEELESKLSESDTKASTLESELEAARKELDAMKTQLAEKEAALETIKKDRATDIRISELVKACIVHNNEEAKAKQFAKIREMSDEDFVAYRDELVSIRQAVLDELAAAASVEEEEVVEPKKEEVVVEPEVKVDEAASVEEEVKKEEEVKEEPTTPPVNIDPGKAILAALNMDYKPTGDVMERYARLGKAMAEEIVKSR